MAGFTLSRRKFLGTAALGGSSLALAGCDVLDRLPLDGGIRDVLESANGLTYRI
jgi:hypothetical protein